MNLCKLADVNHRINRACDHDSQQVAHWIETERTRGEEYSASLLRRQERLQYLRGEDEGRLIESSVGKLKEEINVLNQRLIEAAEEEEAAREDAAPGGGEGGGFFGVVASILRPCGVISRKISASVMSSERTIFSMGTRRQRISVRWR